MSTPRSGRVAAQGDLPALKVAVVARRLGVAPATLRTWARRYGLGPSAHVAGAHRQYSAQDLDRLVIMRRLTLQGVAPAEAARIAVGTPGEGAGRRDDGRGDGGGSHDERAVDERDDEGADAGPDDERWDDEDADGEGDDDTTLATFGRAGGGRVVALPASGPGVRGLARAALSLDGVGCRGILEAAIRRDGVVTAWDELARPVLVALGQRWEATGSGIDVEHLFTEAVLGALRAGTRAERRRSASTVVLACSENEQHSLPLHVLAAALDERGATVRVLGARVPRKALADAVRRTGPAAVLVYAAMPVEDSGTLSELPRLRPAPRLYVGGPGWAGVALPAGATRLLSLNESVRELASVVGT